MKTVEQKIEAGDYWLPEISGDEYRALSKEGRADRRAACRVLMRLFKDESLAANRLKDHPKAEKVWTLVEEFAGSDGLARQHSVCEDLTELILD